MSETGGCSGDNFVASGFKEFGGGFLGKKTKMVLVEYSGWCIVKIAQEQLETNFKASYIGNRGENESLRFEVLVDEF